MNTMFSIGISELVLIVSDVQRAAAFYREVVALAPEGAPDDTWAWFWAGKPGQQQRIALHRGQLKFEEHSPHPSGKRWGNVHFALEVPRDRFEQAQTHVRSHQVTIYGPERLEWMKADSFYFYDPDGNLIEFWSRDVS